MSCPTVSLIRRTAVALSAIAATATLAMAQVQFSFYETFPATPPDPTQPFAGGSVFCTATAAGSATGFNFNFGDAATRQLLCPGNPDRISAANSFGARITGSLVAPSAGTYSFFVSTDDGDRLTINGAIVHTDWVAKGGGPGAIGNLALNAGPNPFTLDYFQGPCCGAFVQVVASGGITLTPPPADTSVVPEPSSQLLATTGLALLAFGVRRRRQA